MKNIIRFLFLTVLLFASSISLSQTIVFEPFGPMDTPLSQIKIEKLRDKLGVKYQTIKQKGELPLSIFYVEEKELSSIIAIVSSLDNNIHYEVNHKYEEGAYRVIYYDETIRKEYMMSSYKESFILFSKILPYTMSNNYLESEIKELIRQLK